MVAVAVAFLCYPLVEEIAIGAQASSAAFMDGAANRQIDAQSRFIGLEFSRHESRSTRSAPVAGGLRSVCGPPLSCRAPAAPLKPAAVRSGNDQCSGRREGRRRFRRGDLPLERFVEGDWRLVHHVEGGSAGVGDAPAAVLALDEAVREYLQTRHAGGQSRRAFRPLPPAGGQNGHVAFKSAKLAQPWGSSPAP